MGKSFLRICLQIQMIFVLAHLPFARDHEEAETLSKPPEKRENVARYGNPFGRETGSERFPFRAMTWHLSWFLPVKFILRKRESTAKRTLLCDLAYANVLKIVTHIII